MTRQPFTGPAPDDETADPRDASFEALGRLVRAAASVEPEAQGAAVARSRFVAGAEKAVRPRGRRWARGGGGVGGPALVAAGALAALLLRPVFRAPPYEIVGAAPGATSVLGGGTSVRFADGTELRLEDDSSGRLTDASAAGARMVLEDGRLTARVTPRPGARWTVEAGPFTVRVTGTQFGVHWRRREGRFEIAMTTGSVTVDGPRFSQRLAAGQRLVATREAGIVQLGPLPASPATGAGPGPTIVPALEPPVPAAAPGSDGSGPRVSSSWSSRVARGQFTAVLDDARAEGIADVLARRGLDDLSALATAARLAGRPSLARRALLAQRARFPGTGGGREAAFFLGRIADDLDGDQTAAIAWYSRYLEESPRGAFAEEALGRKLRALSGAARGSAALREGSSAAARAAARLYLRRFPDGPHAALAREVADRAAAGGRE